MSDVNQIHATNLGSGKQDIRILHQNVNESLQNLVIHGSGTKNYGHCMSASRVAFTSYTGYQNTFQNKGAYSSVRVQALDQWYVILESTLEILT